LIGDLIFSRLFIDYQEKMRGAFILGTGEDVVAFTEANKMLQRKSHAQLN